MRFWLSKRPGIWGVIEGNVTRIIRDDEITKLDPDKFLVVCPVCEGQLGPIAGNCEHCKGTGFDVGF